LRSNTDASYKIAFALQLRVLRAQPLQLFALVTAQQVAPAAGMTQEFANPPAAERFRRLAGVPKKDPDEASR
jgi:hypothetical protein